MKTTEYLVYSISSFNPIFEGRMIKCLRAFAEEGSKTANLCEFSSNKFTPIFDVEIKKLLNGDVIEVFLSERLKYDKLEKVLRKHNVRGDYKHSLQVSFAFMLKKIDEIKI